MFGVVKSCACKKTNDGQETSRKIAAVYSFRPVMKQYLHFHIGIFT